MTVIRVSPPRGTVEEFDNRAAFIARLGRDYSEATDAGSDQPFESVVQVTDDLRAGSAHPAIRARATWVDYLTFDRGTYATCRMPTRQEVVAIGLSSGRRYARPQLRTTMFAHTGA